MRIDKIELSGSLLISSSLSRSPLRINDNYLYINPQGNIGIGTTNPTSKLVVTGSVAVQGQLRATTLSGSFTGSIKLPTIPLGTSETNIVLVDGSGGLVYRSNLSLTGAQGNQGTQGAQGIQGTVGTQGFQGFQGDTGAQGSQGAQGIQGTQGTQGTVGAQGSQGAQGIQGTVGTQGATGASAGITSYTNPADNRVLTSVNSTTINAESNLIFDGTNLGLGVTPSAWRSGDRAFQIGNYLQLFSESGVTSDFSNNTFINSSGQFTYINTAQATRYRQYLGEHQWLTASSGTANNSISFTQAMTLDASGTLLVGATSAINSNFKINILTNSGNGGIVLRPNTDGTVPLIRALNAAASLAVAEIGTSSGSSLYFNTNGSPRLTITSTGAATFSSSVTATQFNVGTGTFNFSSGDALLDYSSSAVRLRTYQTGVGYITPLTINSQTGAATFSGLGTFTNATSNNQLTVNGTGAIKSGINFANGGTTYGQIYFDNNAPYNMSVLQQYTTGNLILGTNNNANLTIANGGNVGIGTTSPSSKLDVVVTDGNYITISPASGTNNTNSAGIRILGTNGVVGRAVGIYNYNDGSTDNNNMLFYTNYATTFSEKMRITSTGNVGIGTISSTVNLLQKYLSITDNYNVGIILNDTRDASAFEIFNAGGVFNINYGTSNRFTITGTGYVGIGTTAPSEKLHVSGRIMASGSGYRLNPTAPIFGQYTADRGYVQVPSNGRFEIWNGGTGEIATFYENKNSIFHGNVGIGTTSPLGRLEVADVSRLTTSGAWSSATLAMKQNGGFIGDYSQIVFGYHANTQTYGSAYLGFLETNQGTNGFGDLVFGTRAVNTDTQPSERMRITSAGNVGIGTTSPGAQLSIFDTNNSRGFQMSFGYETTETFRLGNSNTTGKFLFTQLNNSNGFRFNSSAPNSQGIIFDINTSQFVVNGDTGRIGISRTPTTNILEIEGNASKTTAGDWLANSDLTIKTEIHTIDGALDRINKVRLVSFKYKDEYKLVNPSIEDKFYQNVIAQEYQEIYPDYVYQSEDIFEDKNILQVDTNPMYIDAVASIQQLSAQIDILKQEIINLKNN